MVSAAASEMSQIRKRAEAVLADRSRTAESRLAHLARAESRINAIKSEVNRQQRDFERLKKRVAAKQAERLDVANKSGSRSRMAQSLRRASQVS